MFSAGTLIPTPARSICRSIADRGIPASPAALDEAPQDAPFLVTAVRVGQSHSVETCEGEYGVQSAKCEGIGQSRINSAFAGFIRYVVEIAITIGADIIDCRRNHTAVNCQHSRHGLKGASGAHCMSMHGFGT